MLAVFYMRRSELERGRIMRRKQLELYKDAPHSNSPNKPRRRRKQSPHNLEPRFRRTTAQAPNAHLAAAARSVPPGIWTPRYRTVG